MTDQVNLLEPPPDLLNSELWGQNMGPESVQNQNLNQNSEQQSRESSPLPPWMQGEKISTGEKLEILMYKIVIYIPVAITYGLFSFLFLYYSLLILLKIILL